MKSRDTEIGGAGRDFPTTLWSDILSAGEAAGTASRGKLDDLIRIYWKPVFAYIRAACGKSIEDAKDLTQAFFAYFLEKQICSRLSPDRGTFRGFLKRSVRNFVINAQQYEAVRRPKSPVIPIDAVPEELQALSRRPGEESPEEAYDRNWFNCVMEEAIQAFRERLSREGKGVQFEVFRRYCLESEEPPTYAELAASLGIKETDVDNHLRACRKLFWSLVRDQIRAYTDGDDDVETELGRIADHDRFRRP